MAITDKTKVAIRRHLRFGVAGLYRISPAGGTVAAGNVGYRFFQAYGQLEYRMNNLLPSEEASITGQALGSVGFMGPNPAAGDTFTVFLSGGGLSTPVNITVTAEAGDQPATIAARIAGAAGQNATLTLAGFYAVAPYGTGPYAMNAIPIAEVSFVGPAEFDLATSSTGSGNLSGQVTNQGEFSDPSAALSPTLTVNGWVPLLNALEGAYMGASQNLDTKRADVWQGRSNELGQRFSLYTITQERFSEFLGIPINPDVAGGKFARRTAMRFL